MLNLELINSKKVWLIDCDGTLADTMPAHDKAYELSFAMNEVPFYLEEHQKYAPLGGTILMEKTVAEKGYADKVDNIIKYKQKFLVPCLELLMKPNTELIELIKNRSQDTYVYIVSNGRRKSIEQILDVLGIRYRVDGLITPEVLGSVKPSPEPYNYAMVVASLHSNRKVNPEDVIVFEDNLIGKNSAIAANVPESNIVMVKTDEF